MKFVVHMRLPSHHRRHSNQKKLKTQVVCNRNQHCQFFTQKSQKLSWKIGFVELKEKRDVVEQKETIFKHLSLFINDKKKKKEQQQRSKWRWFIVVLLHFQFTTSFLHICEISECVQGTTYKITKSDYEYWTHIHAHLDISYVIFCARQL